MPYFVGRQLTNPRQGKLHRIVRCSGTCFVGARQSFENHTILAHALASENDLGLYHFTGTRIDNAAAI